MYLILYTLLIILLTVHTIADYKKIKSNKEVVKLDNEIIIAHKELKERLDKRIELEKKRLEIERKYNEEVVKVSKNFENLKTNLSVDYEHIAKEVIKRINEQQRNKENIIINV